MYEEKMYEEKACQKKSAFPKQNMSETWIRKNYLEHFGDDDIGATAPG